VTNLERPLVEIPGARPQPIGTGPVARAIDTVAPHALGKVDPLSGLDHISRRFWSKVAFLKPFGKRIGGVGPGGDSG